MLNVVLTFGVCLQLFWSYFGSYFAIPCTPYVRSIIYSYYSYCMFHLLTSVVVSLIFDFCLDDNAFCFVCPIKNTWSSNRYGEFIFSYTQLYSYASFTEMILWTTPLFVRIPRQLQILHAEGDLRTTGIRRQHDEGPCELWWGHRFVNCSILNDFPKS